MRFEPAIPKIYQQTKILFQVNQLNGSTYHKNLTCCYYTRQRRWIIQIWQFKNA